MIDGNFIFMYKIVYSYLISKIFRPILHGRKFLEIEGIRRKAGNVYCYDYVGWEFLGYFVLFEGNNKSMSCCDMYDCCRIGRDEYES